jgi:hypothetical protein
MVAAFTVGFGETAVGRYHDALRHVREVRHPAERFNNANSADQQRRSNVCATARLPVGSGC